MTSRAAIPLLILTISPPLRPQSPPTPIPARIAEEAEVLSQNAARLLTSESLEQRSIMPPTRFRPRADSDFARSLGPRFRLRHLVSEFSFGPLRTSQTHDLVEFRQVLSVDGHPLQSPDTALRALSEGIRQGDDRARKSMLEQFARNGLVDIASDFSLILLAFTARGQKQMELLPSGQSYVGSDAASSFTWKQKSNQRGVLEFHGQQSTHRALQGTLWFRTSDGLPLRVNAWMEYTDQAGHIIRDEATVDYIMSEHGFLTPASVLHLHRVNATVMTENLYRYEPFKLFSTTSTITFGSPDPAVKK